MDPAAFATLVERCASPAMAEPLTAIVQQASSFEPFLITLGERKPIRLQATDRNEAIQLATEAAATGKPVRIGLGQLDREEMKLAGLTIAATFDACQHVAGLSRLFQVRFQTAIAGTDALYYAPAQQVCQIAVLHGVRCTLPKRQKKAARRRDRDRYVLAIPSKASDNSSLQAARIRREFCG